MPHYYIMDKSNHLAHYGHKGQKWGVRNYQNYDGTYTQAGLERYWPNSKHGTRGGGNVATKTKALKALENGMKGVDSPIKKIKLLATDFDPSLLKHPSRSKGETISRKQDRVATIGLEAIKRLEWYKGDPELENPEQSTANKEWFLFEDQTPGLKQIVDLIDKGYTPEQVRQTAETLSQCAYGGDSYDEIAAVDAAMTDDESRYVWAMSEAYFNYASHDPDDFAKAVSDIIAEEKGKTRGGHERGGMMTDMAEGISEGVVRLGERITDAARRTGERMVDKASAKDEEKRVKRELASLTRKAYGDPNDYLPDAWTRIRSTDLNRQSVVQQLRQDIANGLSTTDARKKYFDQMVKATLADRKLVGNKDAERQLREAWSFRTSPYGYSGLSSAARVREERKLDKQRDELQKMRSKVYDENYNIVDPALYKKYKAAKEQYKADKKSINDRVSRDVYNDYAASKR